MTKELLISSSPHETKVAVLEDDQLVEVYFQRDSDVGLVGGIYKGRVNRVLPGMQSAFVNIGLERDAFLYVSDFFEDSEEYDRVFTEAENRVAKLADSGEEAKPPEAGQEPALDGSGVDAEPAALEPVPPAIMEAAASGPVETPSPESAAANPPVSVAPSRPEQHPAPNRPQEFSGRRNRRRRRFRDFRYGSRRERGRPSDQPREATPAQGIELLPGESLAKYARAAEQTSATTPHTKDRPAFGTSGPAVTGFPEDPLSLSAPFSDRLATPSPAPEAAAGPPTPEASVSCGTSVGGSSSEMGTAPASPLEDHAGQPPAGAESNPQETSGEAVASNLAWGEPEGAAGLERGQESSAADQPATSTDLFSEMSTGAAATSESPEQALGETTTEVGPQAADEATPAELVSETESTPESGDVAAGHSYTLREPSHRARVAPRHDRRGRGRFRGHQGRRGDGGVARDSETPRAGNHRPLPISELLKEGQEILVQIAKEPLGAKGARITSHIALPGRYLVCMPTIDHIGVSRKISSEEERLRLRNIILENRGSLTGGFIVRTAAAGRSEEELKADLAFLTNLWNDIRTKADRIKAPALLHRDLTLVERILRDLLSPDFKCVRVDSEIEYEHVVDFVNRFQPSLIGRVKLYTRDVPMFDEFGVQAEIDRALKPKVWLKSGGYIVINQTEALVAIDVNTGKYVGKTNRLEDTIVKTNIDAVKEIVRQIRLRDLGGIIVIDFIDMDERRNRTKVVQALDEALRHDRAPTKILSFNEFGLVALTRKRVKHSLERTLCEPCPYCTGAGWVKSVSTVSYEIFAEARKMAAQIEGNTLHLRVNPEVAATLKARDGVLISEIEAATRKDLVIKADPNVHQEQFEIY
jgi:ribonuclease G